MYHRGAIIVKMNFKLLSVILIVSSIFISCTKKDESKFHILKGPYLGQKPPGMKAELFAPGIISTEVSEGCVSFSHDNILQLYVLLTIFSSNTEKEILNTVQKKP